MGHISFWLRLMVKILGNNMDTIKKNIETLIDANKEVGLEINRENYEEWCLLGCYAVWLLKEPTFQRKVAPPSTGIFLAHRFLSP
jgi:hypothetical protein